MRRLLILATLAAVASAGCVSTNIPDIASTAQDRLGTNAGAVDTLLMGVADCDAAIAVIPVEAENLAPYVPEGFRPLTPEEVGLPPDPRGDAVLGIETLACGGVYGFEGTVPDAAYGSYFTFVEPPEHLADANKTYHFVKWDHVVADDTYREILAAAGAPVFTGEATVSSPGGHEGHAPFEATLTLGDAEYAFQGVGVQPWTDGLTGSFREFTPTDEGLATWNVEYEWSTLTSAGGSITLDADAWPAKVVGSERASAYYLFGHVVHFTGDFTLPAPVEL